MEEPGGRSKGDHRGRLLRIALVTLACAAVCGLLGAAPGSIERVSANAREVATVAPTVELPFEGPASDGIVDYFAVLVGSGAPLGEHNSRDEAMVDRDVDAMLVALTENGAGWASEHIASMTNADATFFSVVSAFDDIGQQMDGDDVFLFYYTGHGNADGRFPLFNVNLTADLLEQFIAEYLPPAAQKLVLLDACHSGGVVDYFRGKPQVSVLSSSSATEDTAWKFFRLLGDRSMSTYWYATGLDGGADLDGDHLVTAEELYGYAQPRIHLSSLNFLGYPPMHPDFYDADPATVFPAVAQKRLYNTIPVISFVEPSSNLVVAAGSPVDVRWDDSDYDTNAYISLARDADDIEEPWLDEANHTWLAVMLQEDPEGEGDIYHWDTSGTPTGTYSIWAMVYDAEHQPRFARAPGTVTITEPASGAVGGRVVEAGSGLAGVWVTDGTRGDSTDTSGYYQITDVPPGSFTIAPSKPGYSFSPASQPAAIETGSVTLPDFTATADSPPPAPGTIYVTTGIEDWDNFTDWWQGGLLRVRDDGGGGLHYETLLRFTDFSAIPAGAAINSAELQLHLDYMSGATTHIVEAREFISTWPVGTTPPDPYTISNTVIDEATYSGSGTVSRWISFDVTELAIRWRGGGTNRGVILIPEDRFPSYNMYSVFDSSRTPDGSAERPRLFVQYGYPDLAAGQAKPDNAASRPPFCVGQAVNWYTTTTNVGNAAANNVPLGYYLGTSASDFTRRVATDRTDPLAPDGGSDDEHEVYTFTASDLGTRYLNVWVNYNGETPEQNLANNKASYGPFSVVQCNTAPVLSALPDATLPEDGSIDNAIDLWAYASDAESPDSELTYIINNMPSPLAGVSVDVNRYVDIRPAANWNGYADVEIRVSDPQGLSTADTFRVTVTPVNDPPWISPSVPMQSSAQDVPIAIDLTPFEHDLEEMGEGLDWYVTGLDSASVAGEYSGDDLLTFSPTTGFLGSDTVTLHLVDTGALEATQDLVLNWGIGTNDPPYSPSAPSPSQNALGVARTVVLGWIGGDPNAGDTVTYDVYLDAYQPTPTTLVCNDLVAAACDPAGDLASSTEYYWRVVATDNHGAATIGPVWHFTTANGQPPTGQTVWLPLIFSGYAPPAPITVRTMIENGTVLPDGIGGLYMTTGDLTNDGKVDLVITKGLEAAAAVFQISGGAWDTGTLLAGPTLTNAHHPIVAPIRNDGQNWLVYSEHLGGNSGEWLRSHRYSGTSLVEDMTITPRFGWPGWMAPAAVDLDGNGEIEVWFETIQGTPSQRLRRHTWDPGSSSYPGVEIKDGGGNAETYDNPRVGDFLGNGTQTLVWTATPRQIDLVRYTPGSGVYDHTSSPVYTAAGDILNISAGEFDGFPGTDLAVSVWEGTSGSLYLVSGGSYTVTPIVTGFAELLRVVRMADINGDGHAEIYAAGSNGGIYGYDATNGWRLLRTDPGIAWADGAIALWPGAGHPSVMFCGVVSGRAFRVVEITAE